MSDNNIGDQFSGLDMHELIGGPLRAAYKAQTMLEKATTEFLEKVSLEDEGKNDKIEAKKKEQTDR